LKEKLQSSTCLNITLQNEMLVSDLGYQIGPDSAVLISTIKFQNLSLMDF